MKINLSQCLSVTQTEGCDGWDIVDADGTIICAAERISDCVAEKTSDIISGSGFKIIVNRSLLDFLKEGDMDNKLSLGDEIIMSHFATNTYKNFE